MIGCWPIVRPKDIDRRRGPGYDQRMPKIICLAVSMNFLGSGAKARTRVSRTRVVKKLKRAAGPLKYELGTLKMMRFSAELSV